MPAIQMKQDCKVCQKYEEVIKAKPKLLSAYSQYIKHIQTEHPELIGD